VKELPAEGSEHQQAIAARIRVSRPFTPRGKSFIAISVEAIPAID
jgi:hypothetical protein